MKVKNVLGVPWEDLWSDEEDVDPVKVKHRDPPPSIVIPDDLFRTSCRMIQVIVGRDSNTKNFVIHEPLLRASSLYLSSKLDTASTNGDFDILQLPADTPNIFGLINRYLYTGAIPSQDWQYLVPFPLHPLCDIWLLAYDLGMASLVNYVTWCLIQRLNEKRTYEVSTTLPGNVEIIYEHALAGSKLRKLLVDMCVWEFEDFTPSSIAPNRMGWDLYEALKMKNRVAESPLLDVENYYTAEEEIEPKGLEVEVEDGEASADSETVAGSPVMPPGTATPSTASSGVSGTLRPKAQVEPTVAPLAAEQNPPNLPWSSAREAKAKIEAKAVVEQDTQEWESKIKTTEGWRVREYIDPETSTSATTSSSKTSAPATTEMLRPVNAVGEAPLTPPPSARKSARTMEVRVRSRVDTKMVDENGNKPTVEELRELGRAYRMPSS